MAWNEAVITDKGMALLTRTFTKGNIVLTRAVGGEGYTAPERLTETTDVQPPVHEMGLAGVETDEGRITVRVRLQNTGLAEGYTLRQAGIFAREKGAEGEDILFAVIQDKNGEHIPAVTENPEFLLEFDFVIPLSNAENIEVTISSGLYALQSDLDALWDRLFGAIQSVPVQSGALIYNGQEQLPEWSGYDPDVLTLSDCEARTDAGVYPATFTPKGDASWWDGSSDGRTVLWTIGKAPGSLELSESAVTLSGGVATAAVTATVLGDGVVTAKSDKEEVATVTVGEDNKTVTVTGVGTGTANITVSAAAGTDYSAPADKTLAVTVEFPSRTLAENTPEMIRAVARAGQAANYWKVGDTIPIRFRSTVGILDLNGTYYATIIGFDHNAEIEGGNSIHFQLGQKVNGTNIAFADSKYGKTGSEAAFRMGLADANTGGWADSHMRKTICAQFFSAMPKEWQNVIADCPKYTDNTGDTQNIASNVTRTLDKIWLLSEFEVFGKCTYANSAEADYQQQYDYYANGNNKVRYEHDDLASACFWWLRSAAISKTSFCRVGMSGEVGTNGAYVSYGFAPCFSIS